MASYELQARLAARVGGFGYSCLQFVMSLNLVSWLSSKAWICAICEAVKPVELVARELEPEGPASSALDGMLNGNRFGEYSHSVKRDTGATVGWSGVREVKVKICGGGV